MAERERIKGTVGFRLQAQCRLQICRNNQRSAAPRSSSSVTLDQITRLFAYSLTDRFENTEHVGQGSPMSTSEPR
jgi:hypothetical protein